MPGQSHVGANSASSRMPISANSAPSEGAEPAGGLAAGGWGGGISSRWLENGLLAEALWLEGLARWGSHRKMVGDEGRRGGGLRLGRGIGREHQT